MPVTPQGITGINAVVGIRGNSAAAESRTV
jgi:hypothetical protein